MKEFIFMSINESASNTVLQTKKVIIHLCNKLLQAHVQSLKETRNQTCSHI